MTARLADARLRPFVATVWVSEAAPGAPLDRMLPSASPHLVFRLAADRSGGTGVVGGPRSTAYLRTPASAGRTVGAVLQPGVTHLLFDAHGLDLAGQHIEVADLWGTGATEALAERLAAAPTPAAALAVLEAALLDRLARPHALHPAVALGLVRLPHAPVREVVHDSGYSHRRFVELFTRASGFSPKRYARLARFERMLRLWGNVPATPLARLAATAGYSDQPHFTHEFTAHAGITPGEYRRTAEVGSRHVPVNFLQDTTARAGAHSSS